jgi:hypothetical protein
MKKNLKKQNELNRLHSIALKPVRTVQEQKELDLYLATLASSWQDWQSDNDDDNIHNCEPEQFGSIYN